jgi:hypothetical protein
VLDAGTTGGSGPAEPGEGGSRVSAGIDIARELSEGTGAPAEPDVAAAELAGAAS